MSPKEVRGILERHGFCLERQRKFTLTEIQQAIPDPKKSLKAFEAAMAEMKNFCAGLNPK